MRKGNMTILASILVITLVAMAAGAGTMAWFSDIETSSLNTFTAGTLDLTVNDMDDPDVVVFDVGGLEPLKPDDSGIAECYVLKNVGTIAGVPSFHICEIVSEENGLTEPEDKLGDDEVKGELDEQLCLKIWVDDCDCIYTDEIVDTMLWECTVADFVVLMLECEDLLDGLGFVLDPDESIKICIAYEFIEGPDNNWAMGDSITMTLIFDLDQVQ